MSDHCNDNGNNGADGGGGKWADFSTFGNGWNQFACHNAGDDIAFGGSAAAAARNHDRGGGGGGNGYAQSVEMGGNSRRRPRARVGSAGIASPSSPDGGTLTGGAHGGSGGGARGVGGRSNNRPPPIRSPKASPSKIKPEASPKHRSPRKSPLSTSSVSSISTFPTLAGGDFNGSTERPSLSAGLPPLSFDGPLFDCEPSPAANLDNLATITTMPRRSNWNVRDASLPPVPPLCPPLDSRSVVCISDASPSVVATRISDCLWKRSVGVEYDDEVASAYALTSDNVQFTIHLYRGGKSGTLLSNSPPIGSEQKGRGAHQQNKHDANSSSKVNPDFSHIVIVECQRIRGDVITFHRCRRAILSAASGNSDGMDDFRGGKFRNSVGHSPFSFRGQLGCRGSQNEQNDDDEASPLPGAVISSQSPLASIQALERVLDLLRKDRLDAQLLGMESLVMLTDARTSGISTASCAALSVLGSHLHWQEEEEEEAFKGKRTQLVAEIHKWVISLVRDRRVPGNGAAKQSYLSGEFSSSKLEACEDEEATLRVVERLTGGTEMSSEKRLRRGNATSTRRRPGSDTQHFGSMRGLALHALSNALVVASSKRRKGGDILRHALQKFQNRNSSRSEKQHACETKEFFAALVEDLAGASRPPSASSWEGAARCFGTAHDAALAAKCLRLLVTHSGRVQDIVLGDVDALLPSVYRARKIGKASHAVLEREADMFCMALRKCGIESA